MPKFDALYSAILSKSFAAIADTDAIKTSIATSTSVASYITAGLNGAIGVANFGVTQTLSVTTSSQASTYNTTSPIVFTGLDATGAVITESIQPTAAGGGQTVQGLVAFAQVTKIDVPAQTTANGLFEFGVGDILLLEPARELRAGSAGNIKVGYQNLLTDTLPSIAAERHPVLAYRVYSTGSTALPITVYL